jgi:hypothetical protein
MRRTELQSRAVRSIEHINAHARVVVSGSSVGLVAHRQRSLTPRSRSITLRRFENWEEIHGRFD